LLFAAPFDIMETNNHRNHFVGVLKLFFRGE